MPRKRNNKNEAPKKKKPAAKPRVPKAKTLETALVAAVIPWLIGHGFWQGLFAHVVLIFAWKIASHYFP